MDNNKFAEFGKVPSSWEIDKLGNLILLLTDYHANGSYKILKKNVELLDEEDYAVMIRTTNFEKNAFSKNDFKYISESAYHFLEKSKVYSGDILMNKIANAGSVYLMPNMEKPVSLAMNLFLIRVNEEVILQKYAYLFMENYERYIKTKATGSVTKTITKDNVRKLDIAYPNIDTQKIIVNILSSLDNKIENNRKTCEKLEEIAQTIFKNWFVDEAEENWIKKHLEDVATITMGQSPPSTTYNYDGNGLPFFQGSKEFGLRKPKIEKWCSEPKRIAQKDDILISVRAPVGDMNIAVNECCIGRGLASIRGEEIPTSVLYYLIKYSIETIKNRASGGSVFDSLNKKGLAEVEVQLPPITIREKYFVFFETIFKQINTLDDEIICLQQTRDALLPKLMSGELNVEGMEV